MLDTNYKKIKVIGFDLDQTLYPKSPEIDRAIQEYIFEKISEKLNVDIETARKMFGDLYQNGSGLSGRKTLISLGFEENISNNIIQEALENADIAKFLIKDDAVIRILKKINEKYEAVDIITGSNKHNAFTKLNKLGIPPELFSNIITADLGSKSDLSAFYLWFKKYPTLLPENFLYIGDRTSTDYDKPKEIGVQSILVNITNPNEKVDCPQLTSFVELDKFL